MNFTQTARFKRAYRSLPEDVKEGVKETLRTLSINIKYPSLHTKKYKAQEISGKQELLV